MLDKLNRYTIPEMLKRYFPPENIIAWALIIAGFTGYAFTATVQFIRGDYTEYYLMSYALSLVSFIAGFLFYFYISIKNGVLKLSFFKNAYIVGIIAGILIGFYPVFRELNVRHSFSNAEQSVLMLMYFISVLTIIWLIYSSILTAFRIADMVHDRSIIDKKNIPARNRYSAALIDYVSVNFAFILMSFLLFTVFRILIFVIVRSATSPVVAVASQIFAVAILFYSAFYIKNASLAAKSDPVTVWGKAAVKGLSIAEFVAPVRIPTKDEIKSAITEYLKEAGGGTVSGWVSGFLDTMKKK